MEQLFEFQPMVSNLRPPKLPLTWTSSSSSFASPLPHYRLRCHRSPQSLASSPPHLRRFACSLTERWTRTLSFFLPRPIRFDLLRPTKRDLERRNGITTDRERRNAGSLSMRLNSRPTDLMKSPDYEADDEDVAQ